MPENAYLVDGSYGEGWACDRGYRAVGGECRKLTIPDNAYLNEAGDDWICQRHLVRSRDACVKR